MNFNQLKIFYYVAKKKSFSLAAKDLNLTQSNVSIQFRLLEDCFGVHLIKREGKNSELTDAGKVLFDYAKKIFELSQEVETIIANYRTLKQGTLKIYTPPTIAKCYLPEMLISFKRNYPDIIVNLVARNSQEAVDAVLNFESDVAIVGRIHYENKLLAVPLFTEKVVLVCSSQKDLRKRKVIDFKELIGEPIIIREPGSGLRHFILELFEKEGISPNIVMELGTSDAIKQMVERGIGLAFMSYFMVREEVAKGILRVIDLKGKSLNRDYDIVYQKNREASNLIKAFVNQALKISYGKHQINLSMKASGFHSNRK